MCGLHYNHPKQFTEKLFKDWSKKAKKLTTKFTDKQEESKKELKELSINIGIEIRSLCSSYSTLELILKLLYLFFP